MKAIQLFIITILISAFAFGQEPADALRYSFTNKPGGTARNQAIGGAGASLGGEFTSLFINPAGLGFYKTGDFVFTPSYSLKNQKGEYLGTNANAKENNFNLGTSGVVFSTPSRAGKSMKNVSIGIGLNRVADFNNHTYYRGVNKSTSYSEKYLEEFASSDVASLDDAATQFPYGPSLALNTYLLDPYYENNEWRGFRTQADPSKGLLQENNIATTGGITDISLGAGFNMNDKVYFGATLSVPFLNYTRDATFRESDETGTIENFNYFEASEYLETKGVGIAGKFGVIFKPVEALRLGAAVHTPTYYQLTDNYVTGLVTDLEGYGGAGLKEMRSTDLTDGNPLKSTYNLITPWKFIVSGTYLLNEVEDVRSQKGFVTADVEYVNYNGAGFAAPDNDMDAKDYYHSLNNTIGDIYKGAVNVRVGGEMKFNTFMARLGGAYYGNPYVNEEADLVQVSGGIGYRNKGFFADLTYVHSMNKDVHHPYRLDPEFSPNYSALLKNNTGNIIATIGFKL